MPQSSLRRLFAAMAFSGLILHSAAAMADPSDDYINPDRPGIADGSTTVGLGHFQIETALQREFREGGNDRTTFVPTLFRYGFSKKWEVRVEGNTYTWNKHVDPDQGTTRAHGMAPTSIGLKYNFLDAVGTKQPSLGAILRVFPRSGSGDFRSTRMTGDFRLAADWNFAEKWSLNPNVGVAIYEDGSKRRYTAGLAAMTLNYNPSKIVNFFIDTGIQTPEEKGGKTSVIVDAGGAYIIGHDIQLDLSIGTAIAGTTGPHPFVSAGFSKRF